MRKNIFRFLAIGIACTCFHSSCKKEEAGSPVVNITNPGSGQQFKVGDTVLVSAVVSDSRQLTSVTVGLLNSNYISVGNNFSTTVTNNHADIHVRYVIDNLNLATGNYIIFVTASNGQTQTNAYVNIHLTEIPLARKGIYLFSAANNFSFKISKLDSLQQVIPVINLSGDYAGSAISSASHELYTIGKMSGAFNAFDLNDYSLLWTHPSTSATVPTFQNLFLEEDVIYVSYYNGNIKGYDKTSSQKYEVQQQGYFIPDVIFKNDQYFFAELYYPTFHENRIGVFYLVSGVARQESPVNMDMKNMFTLDNDHLFLFGNDLSNSQGKISIYNIPGNGTTELHTIPTGILYKAVQVDNYKYLIAHSGGIYLYDYTMNSLVPFVSGLPVYSMEYDEVNQEVFATSSNQVHVYSIITGSQEYTLSSADSMMDVKVWYNR